MSSADLVIAKIACLLLLSLVVSACGIKIEDSEKEEEEREGHNLLVAMTEGAYGMQLNTEDTVCRRLLDGHMTSVRYTHEADDQDQGLSIELAVAGDLENGDALTADNSNADRFFDFHMVTPSGASYAYSSSGETTARASYAALTVLKATEFQFSARLWIERLAPAGAGPDGSASFRGTFECGRWQGSSKD